MFKDEYKKELNQIKLDDDFKDKTIVLMENHSTSTQTNKGNKTIFFKRFAGLVAAFALCIITVYSSGQTKKDNSIAQESPVQLRSVRNDASARIADDSEQELSGESDFCKFVDMVVVDDVTYWRTGETNDVLRCGMMDGYITSSVDSGKLRTENNQSNFGTGYGYQYGATENTIDVCIDGQWYIFSTMDNEQ